MTNICGDIGVVQQKGIFEIIQWEWYSWRHCREPIHSFTRLSAITFGMISLLLTLLFCLVVPSMTRLSPGACYQDCEPKFRRCNDVSCSVKLVLDVKYCRERCTSSLVMCISICKEEGTEYMWRSLMKGVSEFFNKLRWLACLSLWNITPTMEVIGTFQHS